MPPMNLFEDASDDDCENVTDDEDAGCYDYENAHLFFASKPDPKFNF